jgi:regulator of protease activity HflC (stomatin/prohibitin superfamily)
MDKRIKLIGLAVAGLVVILGLVSASRQLFATNDAGFYQIKQVALSGEMTVHNVAGTYLRLFGDITTYQVSDMHYFSKSDLDGGSSKAEDPIKIRFNDGGTADVSGGIKFRLPSDPEKQLLLHRDFKSYERIKHDLIRQTVAEALMQTATLMRAEESYSTRRSEFTSLAEDQVKVGIYETETREFKDKDVDGNEFVIREVNIKKDKNGQPVIRKESALARYGVEIIQFVVKDIDFDPTIDALIAKKKEAEQMKVVAKANAEKAKQDAITAREQGNARIAIEKANQEVEKIKETTIAQKNFEVSQLQRKQAEQDAAAEITKGKALAEVSKLKVQAGLTPLEKATIDKETKIGVAAELAKVQFPGMMIIGGGGNGSATNPFDAVGLESFMRINDRLNKEHPVKAKASSKDEE